MTRGSGSGQSDGSEFRLVRPWNIGLFSRVPEEAFGASLFLPVKRASADISKRHSRGPRRREDVLVLDCETELQILALGIGDWHPTRLVIFLGVPFESFLGGFVIEHPVPFDHLQSLA